MKVRAFSREWSGSGTEKARSFYIVVGRLFAALALGKRRVETPLHKDTNDRLEAIERRLIALEKHSHPPVALPIEEMQREIAQLKAHIAKIEERLQPPPRPRR